MFKCFQIIHCTVKSVYDVSLMKPNNIKFAFLHAIFQNGTEKKPQQTSIPIHNVRHFLSIYKRKY